MPGVARATSDGNDDEMFLRLATTADAAALRDIYRPYVEQTSISFEAEVPALGEMARRVTDTLADHPWLVAVEGARVLGYAYAHLFAERAAYRWSVETAIYVAADAHRRGVARTLYSALLEIASTQGYRQAFAGITLPNPASVGFHQAFGFNQVATFNRVGWKLGAWHDVGWWQRSLGPGAEGRPAEPTALHELDADALAAIITSG